MRLSTVLFTLLSAVSVTAAEGDRPCGFKIAPCPPGQTCQKLDPSCDRGENCAGVCVPAKPTLTKKPLPSPTSTRTPRPTYKSCGGFRVQPVSCDKDEVCVDDPYVGGCGMACDRPGICVKPVFCGGFAGLQCKDGKICIDDPRDDCDPKNGGADCGGICV